MNGSDLLLLVRREMPFGKYQGRRLCELPGPYLAWFAREGFPAGELGRLLASFWLGLAFILLGSAASAYSARQYLSVLRSLTPAEFPPGYGVKWGLAVNLVVAVLGLALGGALWLWRPH